MKTAQSGHDFSELTQEPDSEGLTLEVKVLEVAILKFLMIVLGDGVSYRKSTGTGKHMSGVQSSCTHNLSLPQMRLGT